MTTYQKVRPNKASNTTRDPLVPVVSAQDLADFMGLGYSTEDDALLNALIAAASEYYIKSTANELLSREYTYKIDRYPEVSKGYGGLGTIPAVLDWWVSLPLVPVLPPFGVSADGQNITNQTTFDFDTRPARVFFESIPLNQEIEILYVAGYQNVEDIPQTAILGIKMLAAFLYEHRGECDVMSAAHRSGALDLWSVNKMVVSL